MKKTLIANAFAAVSVFFLTCGCSVKEGRDGCPCYLYFPESSFDGGGYEGDILLSLYGEGADFRDSYTCSQLTDPSTFIAVPRGMVTVSGIGGLRSNAASDGGGMSVEGNVLRIRQGRDCDPIYAFRSNVDARGETAPVPVLLRKEYASLTISLKDVSGSGFPYRMRLESDVAGIDLRSLEPVRGTFLYEPQAEEAGGGYIFRSRLPRQSGDSLILQIIPSGSGGDDTKSGVEETVELGRIIHEVLDYDWNEPSLSDIFVALDYSLSVITIGVADWTFGEYINVEI